MHIRPLAALIVVAACLGAAQPAAAASPPAPVRTPPSATVLKGLLKGPEWRSVHKPRRSALTRRVRVARRAALRGIDSWTLGQVEPAGSLRGKQFVYLAYWQWSSRIRTYIIWWDLWACRGTCARTTVSYFSIYWTGGWYGPWGPYRT